MPLPESAQGISENTFVSESKLYLYDDACRFNQQHPHILASRTYYASGSDYYVPAGDRITTSRSLYLPKPTDTSSSQDPSMFRIESSVDVLAATSLADLDRYVSPLTSETPHLTMMVLGMLQAGLIFCTPSTSDRAL